MTANAQLPSELGKYAIDAKIGEGAHGVVYRGYAKAAPGTPLRIASARDVETLVDMIVHSPVRRPQAHAFGEPRYWLTFWLTDGTTLGRPYFVETSELMGGVALPGEFARILERYLGE